MSNFDQAFSAAQRGYDNMEPECYDDPELTDDQIAVYATDWLDNGEEPDGVSDLMMEFTYMPTAYIPPTLWALDEHKMPITTIERGQPMVRVDMDTVWGKYHDPCSSDATKAFCVQCVIKVVEDNEDHIIAALIKRGPDHD